MDLRKRRRIADGVFAGVEQQLGGRPENLQKVDDLVRPAVSGNDDITGARSAWIDGFDHTTGSGARPHVFPVCIEPEKTALE